VKEVDDPATEGEQRLQRQQENLTRKREELLRKAEGRTGMGALMKDGLPEKDVRNVDSLYLKLTSRAIKSQARDSRVNKAQDIVTLRERMHAENDIQREELSRLTEIKELKEKRKSRQVTQPHGAAKVLRGKRGLDNQAGMDGQHTSEKCMSRYRNVVLMGVEKAFRHVSIPRGGMSVDELASAVHLNTNDVKDILEILGEDMRENDRRKGDFGILNLAPDLVELVALELGLEAFRDAPAVSVKHHVNSAVKPQPPVVCVLGETNHGKTTLLNSLRKYEASDEVESSSTQKITTFSVDVSKKPMLFIDTPGHNAFHALRQIGARATDMVSVYALYSVNLLMVMVI
jgi:hypothetical protein